MFSGPNVGPSPSGLAWTKQEEMWPHLRALFLAYASLREELKPITVDSCNLTGVG